MDPLVTRLRKHKAAFLLNFLGMGSSSKEGRATEDKIRESCMCGEQPPVADFSFREQKTRLVLPASTITIPTFESTFT